MSAMTVTFRPVIRPSLVAAASMMSTWPRPCIAAWKFSLRVSDHLTGRPSCIAAIAGQRLLGRDVDLVAEAAADLRRDHADLVLLDAEQDATASS